MKEAPKLWGPFLLVVLLSCGRPAPEGAKATGASPPLEEGTPPPPRSLCEQGKLPTPAGDGYLSFPNFGFRGVGRCRAHAILTQQFLYLARFRPERGDEWECRGAPSERCALKVREALLRLERYETISVPGFANLAEFSRAPRVAALLRGHIINRPTRYSARPLGMSGAGPRRALIWQELQRRTELGHHPYIAIDGALTGDHGVLVQGARDIAGEEVLCVRDPNVVPRAAVDPCENFFLLEDSGVRYFRSGRDLGLVTIELMSDEEDRARRYRRALCGTLAARF